MGGARFDTRQQVQCLRRDVRPAQIGAVGRHEAGRQAGAVGAVDDAGCRRDSSLERLLALRPWRHVLIEQHETATQSLDAVLAHLELLGSGRCPPVDGPWLVALEVVTQAVEVTGPEALGERQQVPTEHTLAQRGHVEQVRPR